MLNEDFPMKDIRIMKYLSIFIPKKAIVKIGGMPTVDETLDGSQK